MALLWLACSHLVTSLYHLRPTLKYRTISVKTMVHHIWWSQVPSLLNSGLLWSYLWSKTSLNSIFKLILVNHILTSMGTHTHSQTCALGIEASLHFNLLSLFESNWYASESIEQFCSFSIHQQQAISASASKTHAESLTLGAYIEKCPDGKASPTISFHSPPCSIHTPIQNPPEALDVPGCDPPQLLWMDSNAFWSQ